MWLRVYTVLATMHGNQPHWRGQTLPTIQQSQDYLPGTRVTP